MEIAHAVPAAFVNQHTSSLKVRINLHFIVMFMATSWILLHFFAVLAPLPLELDELQARCRDKLEDIQNPHWLHRSSA
jgi:hypothetical protein